MRYERQILIPQIGETGQEKIRRAHIAVVGAGGLGCPVLTYLACAGVGKITIIDGDTVSEANLNRQFLYGGADIGKSKAKSAAEKLSQRHPDTEFFAHETLLNSENIASLLADADIIVDCVDNISARIMLSDYATEQKIPLVVGAINGLYGFVMTILHDTANLRTIGYDNTKEQEKIPALGATAGVIGSLEATECIKIITGAGKLMTNRMLQYDGLRGEFDEVAIKN